MGCLAISAVTGPSLCVVAGEPLSVEALAARLAEDAIAAPVLPTTHAFHTGLLRPIAEREPADVDPLRRRRR